jgi:hypothetical protein
MGSFYQEKVEKPVRDSFSVKEASGVEILEKNP